MGEPRDKFQQAVAAFDAAHREDPRSVTTPRGVESWSTLYHRRLAHWLEKIEPNASEALRLAARCQHIRRWRIPRSEYPQGLAGYRKWRSDLASMHGEEAADVLRSVGYPETVVAACKALLMKKYLKSDPEAQALEDAVCLTFLENELVDFAGRHSEEKLLRILSGTWKKMSARGHAEAVKLAVELPEDIRVLVVRAAEAE